LLVEYVTAPVPDPPEVERFGVALKLLALDACCERVNPLWLPAVIVKLIEAVVAARKFVFPL
jgi:hypothetical protein